VNEIDVKTGMPSGSARIVVYAARKYDFDRFS